MDIVETFDSNGNFHSYSDRPARLFEHGDKMWYHHGLLHRTQGPARIFVNPFNAVEEFWILGKRYTEKDFRIKLNLGTFKEEVDQKKEALIKVYDTSGDFDERKI